MKLTNFDFILIIFSYYYRIYIYIEWKISKITAETCSWYKTNRHSSYWRLNSKSLFITPWVLYYVLSCWFLILECISITWGASQQRNRHFHILFVAVNLWLIKTSSANDYNVFLQLLHTDYLWKQLNLCLVRLKHAWADHIWWFC